MRGFRIELEEIEAVLLRHPRISGVVAMVRADDPQQPSLKRLVAYIRPGNARDTEDATLKDELRHYLKEALPDYMIPSALVFLEQFPVTPNGKIDRRLLPSPEGHDVTNEKGYVAPRNAAEATMAEVWAAVLGREKIGVFDNFFELGGDSLLSIQIKARARQAGIEFDLHQLFEYPTIAELVDTLPEGTTSARDETTREEAGQDAPAPFSLLDEADRVRLPEGLDDAYPLSHLQMGLLYHGSFDGDTGLYHVALLYQINRPFERDTLETVLTRLARRHEMLRTSFDLDHYSQPIQLVHREPQIPMEVQDLTDCDDLSVWFTGWFEEDKRRPFDPGIAPLLRIGIFLIEERSFKLSLSFHHAVMDGWSDAALLTELVQEYTGLVDGTPPAEPAPLRTTYRDFVRMEQETLKNSACRAWWQERMTDLPDASLPRLPFEAEEETHHTLYLPVSIPDEVSEGIYALSKETNVPLKSVLLASHLKAPEPVVRSNGPGDGPCLQQPPGDA